ncbi:hypothetical protein [Pedobacter hartonius]|uniref:Uncharacterized protein n=1 Tax=Pedobacter hartonius TaxID=425514 RepID=A0A1H3WF59_9SPHI|nr:hypothetical protein [Pedobacter hartonius]SDZ84868.1 hypothetical protein SAMN05443550_101196 [Pedobacter hartonius]
MARQNGKFISGVLGPLVYRVVNGKQIISTKTAPGTIKQTTDTKRSADTFGMGSSLGASIRKTLAGQLSGFYDIGMISRLNGKMAEILGTCRNPKSRLYQFETNSFSRLDDFEFNANSEATNLLSKAPTVVLRDGILTIMLPKLVILQHLKFPNRSYKCEISFNVSLFRLRDGLMKAFPDTQSFLITKNMKEVDPDEFIFAVPDGCLCVVSVFLNYLTAEKTGWKSINSKKFNPGCICAALISPGAYKDDGHIIWTKMTKFE